MANVIAGLAAQLGLDTTEFQKGIGEAKEGLKSLTESFGLAEVVSIAAFTEMVNKSMEFSNKISETAKANDVTVTSVLELSKALSENGGEVDGAGKVYSSFTQKIEAAAMGSAKAQESFHRIGISLNDLRTLSEQDLFEKTIKGLAQVQDSAQRNGLAFETLGKSMKGVDIVGLARSMEEGKGSMDKYTNSIEQAHQLSDKLKNSAHTLMLEFNNAFIPTINVMFQEMGKTNGIMDKFFETLKTGTQIAGVAIYAIIDDFNHLWGVVKLLGKDMYAVFDPKEYVNGTILETLNGNLKQFKDEWSDDAKSYEDSVKRIRDANSEIAQPVKQEKANRPIIEAGAKQILAAQDLAKEYENQQRIQMQMLEQKESLVFKTKEQKELEAAVNKVIDDNAKALEKVRAEMAKVDRNTVPGQRAYSEMQKQYNQIAGDLQNFKDQAEQIVTESQKQRESFSYGWQSAFNQYAENATTAADTGAKAFNTVVGTMDSALDTFVKKGKLNFHSLAQSIIQDLLSMQLKMQANRMFASLPGLGSLFGGGGVNIGTQSGADMMQAFADGGDPPVGQASLVGERGPELFIPKSAGTIIPNNQLGGMGGTTNNVTNYNISAIDTKSFEDRIYGSSNAVWAAGQYAQKNLATNRART